MNDTEYHQQRKFIVQPECIPVKVSISKESPNISKEIHDKSCHGLIIKSKQKIDLNKVVNIKIAFDHLNFEGDGVVSFCRAKGSEFDIGIEFSSSCDPFEVKMTLQVCQIKEFLNSKQKDCVENDNALGWIKMNASSF